MQKYLECHGHCLCVREHVDNLCDLKYDVYRLEKSVVFESSIKVEDFQYIVDRLRQHSCLLKESSDDD